MNWKNIKNFLIVLFIIINVYLIFSANGFDFYKKETTYTNKKVLSDTINIIKNNYNITVSPDIVPGKFKNLGIIDVTNIIYTDKFRNSKYHFKTNIACFEAEIKTDTFSYNESNAELQITEILKNIGIEKETYKLNIVKSDNGLVCHIKETLAPYPIFNGQIKATFSPSAINMEGSWYIYKKNTANEKNSNAMSDITGVIISLASEASHSDGTPVNITNIDYGYYVSTYDENSVSKSSSAIPCYLLETDEGSKYYYDALNGKPLKQED